MTVLHSNYMAGGRATESEQALLHAVEEKTRERYLFLTKLCLGSAASTAVLSVVGTLGLVHDYKDNTIDYPELLIADGVLALASLVSALSLYFFFMPSAKKKADVAHRAMWKGIFGDDLKD